METVAVGTSATEMRATTAFHRLCVMGFLAHSSYAICRTPLLPLLARELGAAPPMVGFVVGASTLTGVLVKLPAGAWSDLLGRRPLLILGAVVFATMPFTHLGVGSLAALVAVRFVHGAATAIFGPVASASLSDLAPARRRATWLSTYAAVQGAGQALGPVIAGYLIARGRYDLAFVIAGCVALATPFLAAGPNLVSQSVLSACESRAASSRSAVSHRFWITSLAQAAQFVCTVRSTPSFRCLRDAIGLTASQLGWLFAFQTATTPRRGRSWAYCPTVSTDGCHRRGSLAVAPRCGSSRRPPG